LTSNKSVEFLGFSDIHQMAVSIPEKSCHEGHWALAEVMHEGEWTQAARGIAGRANVRLCFASSLRRLMVCWCRLVAELPATGGVVPSWTLRTVKLLRYVTPSDYFVLACEIIFMLFIVYYCIEEAIEVCFFLCNGKFKSQTRTRRRVGLLWQNM